MSWVCHFDSIKIVVTKGKKKEHPKMLLARRTGLEPVTYGVTGRCCNQLNYRPKKTWDIKLLKTMGTAGFEPATLGL